MHATAYKDAALFVRNYLGQYPLRIAEIGSMDVNGSIRPLFTNPLWTYTGFDLEAGKGVDVVLPSEYFWHDVKNNTFDVVVSTQTMEHVRRPWHWIKEIARILCHCGLVYICAPNTWIYHEHPWDCWRVWSDGMRALFDDAGLTTLEVYHREPGPDYGPIGDTTGIARK